MTTMAEKPMARDAAAFRRKHRTIAIGLIAILVLGWAGSTFVLFVKPDKTDNPHPADAIVMLGGNGPRLGRVYQLSLKDLAPTIVLSDPDRNLEPCKQNGPNGFTSGNRVFRFGGKQIVCFHPVPKTTRGEARSLAKLATRHGWKSLIVVVSTDQVTRAKLLLGRCWAGNVQMVSVHPSQPVAWRAIYEWGAIARAVVLRRDC
ncbi:MAG: hypothetical protein JWL73_744 [Actinomycetia bacterium]|nr:hypothetical protein [Actinomycetes bacterium]